MLASMFILPHEKSSSRLLKSVIICFYLFSCNPRLFVFVFFLILLFLIFSIGWIGGLNVNGSWSSYLALFVGQFNLSLNYLSRARFKSNIIWIHFVSDTKFGWSKFGTQAISGHHLFKLFWTSSQILPASWVILNLVGFKSSASGVMGPSKYRSLNLR